MGKEIYCFGIIDILTVYNARKRLEHFMKSAVNDSHAISAVDPTLYAHRFVDFISGHVK